MASLSGAQFNITGASGTASALVAKSGWFAYVLPRGAHAAADSTGVDITLDSTSASDRFAVNNWIQVGTDISKIRRVTLVGSGIRVNSAVTVSENDRIFLIGATQPSTSGGSATYTIPATTIRKRDDSSADIYTNSMVTSTSDGLIQWWSAPNFYDVLVQDGNQSLQGSIIDLPVGSVGGISTDVDALFGASLTVNGAFGVTGWATFGSTVTMNAALGVTGWATFGASVTMNANAGVTGTLTVGTLIGTTVTVQATIGVTGQATFGATATFSAGVTIGGQLAGVSATFSQDVLCRRLVPTRGTTLTAAGFSLTAGWGSTATLTLTNTYRCTDTSGYFLVEVGGTGITNNPTVVLNNVDGGYENGCIALITRIDSFTGTSGYWNGPVSTVAGMTQVRMRFVGLPQVGDLIAAQYLVIGT